MTMRQLGLSIYPDHSDFEENAAYLKLGQHYGFTRIFMSMLEVVRSPKPKLSTRKSLTLEISWVTKRFWTFHHGFLNN